MNEEHKQTLSDLLDDELLEHERSAVLRDILASRQSNALYRRYQLIGEHLRQLPDAADASDMVSRVAAELENVAPHNVPKPSSSWQRAVWGAALAASVATAAVVVAPRLMDGGDAPGAGATLVSAEQPVSNRVAGNMTMPVAGNDGEIRRWRTLDPALRSKLDNYLIEHAEYSGYGNLREPNQHVGFVSLNNAR